MNRMAGKLAATAEALQAWLDSEPTRRARPVAPALPVEQAVAATDPGRNSMELAHRSAAVALPPLHPPQPESAAAQAAAAPLRLPHTDWLYHRLAVTGPAPVVKEFAAAAAGAGVIPWQLDLDRLAEDMFHRLVAPPPPQRRSLGLSGARILADQLCQATAKRHALAIGRVGVSRACPLDLHALLPVPTDLLVRGPDDPAALAWLWAHWGTTEALRHVRMEVRAAKAAATPPADAAGLWVTFWSADWTPWRAFAVLAAQWPALRFLLRPVYDLG